MTDWPTHMLAGAAMSVLHLPLYPILMNLMGQPVGLGWWIGYIGTGAFLIGWTLFAALQVRRIHRAGERETNSQRRRRLRGRKRNRT